MSELLLSLLYIYTHHITPYMYIYICIYIYILYICSYPLATYINSHWAGNDNGWAVIFCVEAFIRSEINGRRSRRIVGSACDLRDFYQQFRRVLWITMD